MERHGKAKWLIAAICAVLFLLIALLLPQIAPVDQVVYRLVSGLISPFATGFFMFFTGLASTLPLLLLCFALVLWYPHKEYRVPLLLNLMLAVLLNIALKDLVGRPRPIDVSLLASAGGYSFPSGHTMSAACLYGFLMYLALHSNLSNGKKRLVITTLSIVIFLVGLSRIYLGVHYFSDVLAAIFISVFYLIVFTAFVNRYFAHHNSREKEYTLPQRAKFLSSFHFALEGIASGLKAERNMIVHFGIMTLVVVFGGLLGLSKLEWILCILLFGLVFMAELFNTSIEAVVDKVSPEVHPQAKLAKDTAAGAVLVICTAAALVGAFIFMPKIWAVLLSSFH